ncbi:MAG: phosphotransferase family protein [Dehalococcoidia bacterium]
MEQALAEYLAPRLEAEDGVAISGLLRIPGGASRETWMFEASWTRGGESRSEAFILRKDPPASLLETDREVEYAFYSTFAGSAVPVPAMRWLESDPSILGGPFFIMDRIPDCEANQTAMMEPRFQAVHEPIAKRMYEILGAIALFSWKGTEAERVSEAPRPDTAWEKELSRWEQIIDEEELSPQPIARAGIRWLRNNPPPPAQRVSVVHGDYRVGNILCNEDGTIRGVVDWEMAHLGDPIEDLAWSFNESWQWAGDGRPGGIVERETAIALWEQATGLTADRKALHWWEVLSNIKCQGIWLTGARSFQEGRSGELILPVVAYSLINAQDERLLRSLGRAP